MCVIKISFPGLNNHLRQAVTYRKKATDIYQKLAVLLDKPIIHKSFEIDKGYLKLTRQGLPIADGILCDFADMPGKPVR